jgi:hypothetical protein
VLLSELSPSGNISKFIQGHACASVVVENNKSLDRVSSTMNAMNGRLDLGIEYVSTS